MIFKQTWKALGVGALTLLIFLSVFFVFWTPLPLLTFSGLKAKRLWFVAFFTAVFLAALFYIESPLLHIRLSSLGTFVYYLLVACLLTLGVWKRWRLARLGFVVSVTATAFLFVFGLSTQLLGILDWHHILNTLTQEASAVLDQMAASSSMKGDRLEMLTVIQQTKEGFKFLPKLLPCLLFNFTLLIVILNIGVARLLYRASKPLKGAGDFRRLQIPHFCVWLVIASGLGFFIDVDVLKQGWLKVAALNLFIAVAFVYFLQGLSILAFFLKRYSLLFRFGIYGLLVLFFQMLGLLVMGLGLADIWFDFRKLQKQTAVK